MRVLAVALIATCMYVVSGQISRITDQGRQHEEPRVGPFEQQHQWHRHLQQNPDRPATTGEGRLGNFQDFVPDGYPFENHKVWTPDGWVLHIHRVPRGKQRHSEPGSRPAVLLCHGFSLSSLSFALYNPDESIAWILADAGFDVWLYNSRGNDFSRGNLKYSFRDTEYWYTSMDEMALIDMPATINYILKATGRKKVLTLTHSQGGTLLYAMLSALPDMSDKVAVVVAMGPPVFLELMRAPFLRNWANARNDKAFKLASVGEFLTSRRLWSFLKQCQDFTLSELCTRLTYHMFYGPSFQIALDDWPVISNTWPATVAARDVTHWAQMMTDHRMRLQRFDYGTDCANLTRYAETCNQQKYGSLEPPEYDLGKIKVPVFIFQGSLDMMVVEEDAAEQQRRIPGAQRINFEGWSHQDFVWDRNARHALDVVDILFRFVQDTL